MGFTAAGKLIAVEACIICEAGYAKDITPYVRLIIIIICYHINFDLFYIDC